MSDLRTKVEFAIAGLAKLLTQAKSCPSCSSDTAERVSSKGPYQLVRCASCSLLYRWPYETAEELAKFYQTSYRQKGLTTDLPDPPKLDELLKSNFKSSKKDFSRFVELFRVLKIPSSATILDFGANWGYGAYQFNRAGFRSIGFELSEPRAAFAEQLDVDVFTDWSRVIQHGPYDVVFSSHVLEHTPNPRDAIGNMVDVLSPGGFLISVFPNGSNEFQLSDSLNFNLLWGKVHPVMLDGPFLRKSLPIGPLALSALNHVELNVLADWNQKDDFKGCLTSSELLMIWKRPATS